MKKTYLILLTLVVLLSTFSCKKYVSQDDINPNLPITATMQTLLPTIEVDIFAEYTGQNARNAGCWVQHFTGTQFQMYDHSNYKMTENDVDNDWNTLYAS